MGEGEGTTDRNTTTAETSGATNTPAAVMMMVATAQTTAAAAAAAAAANGGGGGGGGVGRLMATPIQGLTYPPRRLTPKVAAIGGQREVLALLTDLDLLPVDQTEPRVTHGGGAFASLFGRKRHHQKASITQTRGTGGDSLLSRHHQKRKRTRENPVMTREYLQVAQLAEGVERELRCDLVIHRAEILPSFLHLGCLATVEYGSELRSQVRAVLTYRPPPFPTPAARRMVVAVGHLEKYWREEGLTPRRHSSAHMDAEGLFYRHVQRWVNGSRAALVATCRHAEGFTLSRGKKKKKESKSKQKNTSMENYDDDDDDVEEEEEEEEEEDNDHDVERGMEHPDAENMDPLTGAVATHIHHLPTVSSGQPECRVTSHCLPLVEAELDQYEVICGLWPSYAVSLEVLTCTILRTMVQCMGKRYGGLPSQIRRARESGGGKSGLLRVMRTLRGRFQSSNPAESSRENRERTVLG